MKPVCANGIRTFVAGSSWRTVLGGVMALALLSCLQWTAVANPYPAPQTTCTTHATVNALLSQGHPACKQQPATAVETGSPAQSAPVPEELIEATVLATAESESETGIGTHHPASQSAYSDTWRTRIRIGLALCPVRSAHSSRGPPALV